MADLMAEQLLRRAHAELNQISAGAGAEENFLHAHMAALRAGAAVLTLHPGGLHRRRAVRSVWEQLAEVDESWESWAALFAAGAPIRAAIETGRDCGLTQDQAARTCAVATDFVELVDEAIRSVRELEPFGPAMAS